MAIIKPSVSYSFTIRVRDVNRVGQFARIMTAIAQVKGDPGPIDLVRADRRNKVRDIEVNARDSDSWSSCRLQAAHGVIRAFEALTT